LKHALIYDSDAQQRPGSPPIHTEFHKYLIKRSLTCVQVSTSC